MPTMQWSRRPVWFSLYRFLSTSLKGLFECAWRAGSFRHQTNFAPVDDLRIHPASISWLAVQWCQSDCWRSSWQHQRPALGQASYQMLEPPGFLSTIKFMGLTWITYELRANQCKSFQIIDSDWLIDDGLIHDLLVELCWIALFHAPSSRTRCSGLETTFLRVRVRSDAALGRFETVHEDSPGFKNFVTIYLKLFKCFIMCHNVSILFPSYWSLIAVFCRPTVQVPTWIPHILTQSSLSSIVASPQDFIAFIHSIHS